MCAEFGIVGRQDQCGLTLIELLLFIVIVGVAATAMLTVFAGLGRSSASLLPEVQAQVLAAGMMQEILARPAFCGSSTPADGLGPEAGETRATPYNNANDYHGYDSDAAGGIAFMDGVPLDTDANGHADFAGYRVQVAIASATLPPVPAADTQQVTVTVTPPVGAPVRLDAVRLCYATSP